MPFYGGRPCKGKKNLSFREEILHFFRLAIVRGIAARRRPAKMPWLQEID
jgi:hypothetical protein